MVNLTVDSVTLDRLWQEAATSWNTVGASGFDGLKLLADALDDNGLTPN